MADYDIERISKNISKREKDAIKNIDKTAIQSRIGNLDISAVAKEMRRLNLNEAADKLSGMSNGDLVNLIASNPEIIDKIKKIFD